jgi:hypothetical protein
MAPPLQHEQPPRLVEEEEKKKVEKNGRQGRLQRTMMTAGGARPRTEQNRSASITSSSTD